jgi:predicted ATPase with chaperone activity
MLDEFLLRTFCYQNPGTNRGSLFNRIDVYIKFPYLDYEKLSGDRVGESSESVCGCVQAARDIQRLSLLPQYLINAIFAKAWAVAVVLGL